MDQDPAKHGSLFHGHPVLPASALLDMPDATIVVALPGRADAIIDDLSRRFNVSKTQFLSMDAPLMVLGDDFSPNGSAKK